MGRIVGSDLGHASDAAFWHSCTAASAGQLGRAKKEGRFSRGKSVSLYCYMLEMCFQSPAARFITLPGTIHSLNDWLSVILRAKPAPKLYEDIYIYIYGACRKAGQAIAQGGRRKA